jgi:hypothetical protein
MLESKVVIAWLVVVSALALTGCAAKRNEAVTYHDPSMDFSLIRSVAVVPFENRTADRNAGEIVRDILMTMLQATGAVYVVPPGEVGRGLSRVSADQQSMPTPEEVVELAANVSADAVITGAVLEYGQARSGTASANLVTVTVRMMEGETGRVIWSAASTKGGVTAGDRLVGGGGRPMAGVTEAAVEDLLDKLFR